MPVFSVIEEPLVLEERDYRLLADAIFDGIRTGRFQYEEDFSSIQYSGRSISAEDYQRVLSALRDLGVVIPSRAPRPIIRVTGYDFETGMISASVTTFPPVEYVSVVVNVDTEGTMPADTEEVTQEVDISTLVGERAAGSPKPKAISAEPKEELPPILDVFDERFD